MIVVESIDENLYLASRNLPKVAVLEVAELNPVDLIAFDKVVMTQGALNKLGEQLA
jgi:large subunit ribosomal protein L4